jgi:predicted ABC-type ATPase
VRNGGHDIPKDIVHRRFDRSLPNFFRIYKPLADSWAIFDNSKDIPKMIAFEESGKVEIFDQDLYDIISQSKEEQ